MRIIIYNSKKYVKLTGCEKNKNEISFGNNKSEQRQNNGRVGETGQKGNSRCS